MTVAAKRQASLVRSNPFVKEELCQSSHTLRWSRREKPPFHAFLVSQAAVSISMLRKKVCIPKVTRIHLIPLVA
jgi:hypothetical protein